jgi:flagellar basal-body rod protein FlgB
LQPFDLSEQTFQPTPESWGHGWRGLLRRGAETAYVTVQPGKIGRITLGKTCLCLGQAFPHGLDGGQHCQAMLGGRGAWNILRMRAHRPIQQILCKKTIRNYCNGSRFNAFWPATCKDKCMDPTKTGPIALSEQRLRWAEARQRVLAQNIANADTPNYRPSDMQPFAKVLAGKVTERQLTATNANHLQGSRSQDGRTVKERISANRDPSGNAVSLEREALRVADTDSAHAVALSVRRRYMSMFMTALGRNQS